MKGDPEFIILKHAAWMSADFEKSILGAIIRDPLSPSSDHVPDAPLRYNQYHLQESTAMDYILDNTAAATVEVNGAITAIANFAVKGRAEDKIHLKGKMVRVKRLQQVSVYWDALRSDPTVKSVVPGWVSFFNTWPVCMVVGIMICEGTEFGHNATSSAQYQAAGKAPVGTIALMAGATNLLGNPTDPKLAVEIRREAATGFEARFESNQIFAVELRKVTTKLFNWKELRLRSDGPANVDPSRLASAESDDDTDDNVYKPVDPDDLICIEIDSTDIDDMAR